MCKGIRHIIISFIIIQAVLEVIRIFLGIWKGDCVFGRTWLGRGKNFAKRDGLSVRK